MKFNQKNKVRRGDVKTYIENRPKRSVVPWILGACGALASIWMLGVWFFGL